MPLPTTGPLSLSDIAAEFGGTPPHSISEYFGAASGVPGQGLAIGVGHFRGKSGSWQHTITANQQELNLRTYALANGWDGASAAEITIASGIYIWSDNTALAGLDTGGAWPGGLTIINNGFIMGKGGDGGGHWLDASSNITTRAATSGGPAINLTTNAQIDNTNGYIGGGGGGGGSTSAGAGGGGAGGGAGGGLFQVGSALGGNTYSPYYCPPSDAPVTPGQPGVENFFAHRVIPGTPPAPFNDYQNIGWADDVVIYQQHPGHTGAGGASGVLFTRSLSG
jgi:hypothetical protein